MSDAGPGGAAPIDAAAAHPEHGPAPLRRPLSLGRVAASAIDLVEEHGLAALSMRRLASTLGVEAMSLYHYVSSRDALLDAMVEQWLDRADSRVAARSSQRRGWQEGARGLATAVRQTALSHPRTFPLVVDHGSAASHLRPPLRRASWYEGLWLELVDGGLGDQDAARVCHRLADFLLGYLLSETAQAQRPALPTGFLAGASGLDSHPNEMLDDLSVRNSDPRRASNVVAALTCRQVDADFVCALDGFIRWTEVFAGEDPPAMSRYGFQTTDGLDPREPPDG